jgi:type IV secretion system protein VirB10
MKKTTSEHTPQVAGKKNSGKYVGIAILVIVMVVIVHGIFSSAKKPVVSSKDQESVNIADTNTKPLNLSVAVAPVVEPLPQPIVPVPPPPPPSVLAAMRMNAPTNVMSDDSRLRAPTQIYSYDNSATATQPTLPGNGDINSSFAQQAANAQVVTVAAKENTHMDYKILQGKFISADLETSINSDMPGMARAVVSKDIYSDTGKFILLPRGTRLIGMYNSNVAVGQTRVMVVWTRAITPQHLDIALGSPGTDSLGQSGMTGTVDNHFWQTFGSSALLSVLGAAASTNSTSSSGAANAYQTAVTQGMTNASSSMLQNRINIKPTIRIEQGTRIEVFVVRDLDFSNLLASNS